MTRGTSFIRGIRGDVAPEDVPGEVAYCHEHYIIDSRLIADEFPHIHLHDLDAAVEEASACVAAGAGLLLDAMPISSGRDAARLAELSRRTGADVVVATGLHHDRYYGPGHWTNHVSVDDLTRLFVEDLVDGIDRFDYTGPIVNRLPGRAGVVKAATSGADLDDRDRRVLEAVAAASVASGAPVLTHCEGGLGGMEQVEALTAGGVPAGSIILSHVDKAEDLGYLDALAQTGAVLELDQTLRQADRGAESISVRAVEALVAAGYADRIVVGTDGARRSLWTSLGGAPGLAWLAASFPALLRDRGLPDDVIHAVMKGNALRALAWRDAA